MRFVGCDHRVCASDDISDGKERIYEPPFPSVDAECERKIRECDVFGLEYLIAALLSRGAVVKDQILVNFRLNNKSIIQLTVQLEIEKDSTRRVIITPKLFF